MNFSSTFGIFVLLLFAYCTPIQGGACTVFEVVFENDERYVTNAHLGRSTDLNRVRKNTFDIRETILGDAKQATRTVTRATLEIKHFHTMLRDFVVVVTDRGLVQLELASELHVQQLFDITARPNLCNKLYSYRVSAVYEYKKGCILENVSMTGYIDSVSDNPKVRYIIHSGKAAAAELDPHLLWTAHGFNYRFSDNIDNSVILTLPKLGGKTFQYYLVEFKDPSELDLWNIKYSVTYSGTIPEASDKISNYFSEIYDGDK